MTWNRAALCAVAWLAGLCLAGGGVNLLGSTQASYYVGYLAAPIAIVVFLVAWLVHRTWKVPVLIYVIGIVGGIGLSLLGLALSGAE